MHSTATASGAASSIVEASTPLAGGTATPEQAAPTPAVSEPAAGNAAAAFDIVTLDPALQQRVEAQVDAFVGALLTADVHGEDFKRKLDSAFRLGRKEVAEATRLNTAFMKENFRGIEDSAAYQAMAELRHLMDDLNPGAQGDLLAPVKWFGLIPGGVRLKAYLRKFESGARQTDRLHEQLSAAQDDLERDVIAIEDTKAQVWQALINLQAAAYFARRLQEKLQSQVDALKAIDPLRARALEQEALFYAAQNLEGLLAQQAVSINGYLALEPLKKTAREMSIGIDRLKTTGMAALAIAQTVAIATQHQVRIQQAMTETKETLGNLVVATSQQLGQHVATVGKFATDPLLEIQKLQTAFDNTFKALDAMDNLRSNAVETMVKNNAQLQELIDRARPLLERASAGAGAARVDPVLAGPVAL
ncbi:MAG TPA: toxic anion resistance protein [Burkholderiaceae bacterium]|nr:toxic anion resistance protein [Burkholderiaceae bacterium]